MIWLISVFCEPWRAKYRNQPTSFINSILNATNVKSCLSHLVPPLFEHDDISPLESAKGQRISEK